MIFEKQQMKNYSKGGEEARSQGCRPSILQEVHLPLHQETGGQHVGDIVDGDNDCNDGDVDNAMEMISSRVVSGNKKYFQTLLGLLIFSLILSVLAVVTW